MVLAAKCSPNEQILSDVNKAGLGAVELYLSEEILVDIDNVIQKCKDFPFRYTIHTPNNCYSMEQLAKLSEEISAEVVVFHNIYWEDEWANIVECFKGSSVCLCMENTHSSLEVIKFRRRYGIDSCLDFEHLQVECAGIFKEVFNSLIMEASHIHMTGYQFGSKLWHTPIHHSPEHGRYLLGLLKKANYSGFIVSEASVSYQNYSEFKKLVEFFKEWEKNNSLV